MTRCSDFLESPLCWGVARKPAKKNSQVRYAVKHRLKSGINLLIRLFAKGWILPKMSNYSLWDFYFSCTGRDSLTKLRLCLLFLTSLLSASPETQICIEKLMKVAHPAQFNQFFFCGLHWRHTYPEMVQARHRRPPGKQRSVAGELPRAHRPRPVSSDVTLLLWRVTGLGWQWRRRLSFTRCIKWRRRIRFVKLEDTCGTVK